MNKLENRKVIAQDLVLYHVCFDKDEILEMYLNCIYFGENCYGIKEAAGYYFGKTPDTLTSTQADSLVYTIKCPNLYNPVALAGETS